MKVKLIAGLTIFVVAVTAVGIWSQVKANGCSDAGFIAGARPDLKTGLLVISTVPTQNFDECDTTAMHEVTASTTSKTNYIASNNVSQQVSASKPMVSAPVIADNKMVNVNNAVIVKSEVPAFVPQQVTQDQPEVYYQSIAPAPQINIVPDEVSVPEVAQIQAPNIVNQPAQIGQKIVPVPQLQVAPAPLPIAQIQAPKITMAPVVKIPAIAQPAVQPIAARPKSTAILVEKPSTALGAALDLDKLSLAVAMQETHNCQDKQGAALVNNCHGFKKNGQFMKFNSPAESHAYFKQLWAKSYKRFPDLRLAQIYSGNDRAQTWLKNVTYYYYNS